MAMTSEERQEGRLAPRNSLIMIIFGAVLGWVLAFVIIYGVVRGLGNEGSGPNTIIFADEADIRELTKIQPAAGPADTSKTPETAGTPK